MSKQDWEMKERYVIGAVCLYALLLGLSVSSFTGFTKELYVIVLLSGAVTMFTWKYTRILPGWMRWGLGGIWLILSDIWVSVVIAASMKDTFTIGALFTYFGVLPGLVAAEVTKNAVVKRKD